MRVRIDHAAATDLLPVYLSTDKIELSAALAPLDTWQDIMNTCDQSPMRSARMNTCDAPADSAWILGAVTINIEEKLVTIGDKNSQIVLPCERGYILFEYVAGLISAWNDSN